jgi:hypothetical protein
LVVAGAGTGADSGIEPDDALGIVVGVDAGTVVAEWPGRGGAGEGVLGPDEDGGAGGDAGAICAGTVNVHVTNKRAEGTIIRTGAPR